MKYIAFCGLAIFMLGTWITEYKLNKDTDDFRCYYQQEFKHRAENGMCPGYWKSCKHCTYKKNYDKENKLK